MRRQSSDALKPFDWWADLRSTKPRTLRPGALQTRQHALPDALSLELGDLSAEIKQIVQQ